MKKNAKKAGRDESKRRPRLLEMRAIPLSRLEPHPDAEAFGAEEEDRAALAGSVAECGLLDPLSVIEAEPGAAAPDAEREGAQAPRYYVIDGCGRLEALRSRGGEDAAAPCMVFDLGDFSVREFALHRNTMQRKVTTGQRVLCALAVSRETAPTKVLASRLGCSNADVVAANELIKAVSRETADAETEAARVVYDDVMAGRTPIRRWKAALAGRTATKDKPKKPVDYKRLCNSVCASLRTICKAWGGLKGALRDEIGEKLRDALAEAPSELRLDLGLADAGEEE